MGLIRVYSPQYPKTPGKEAENPNWKGGEKEGEIKRPGDFGNGEGF